jgi:GDPmannose 4,6-dehydratase
MKKIAIITGITGQDGAYLAQFLLNKEYKVIGTYRRSSTTNFWRIQQLEIKDNPDLELIEHDLFDSGDNYRLLEKYHPDEIYNLAAQSFVQSSFESPINTAQITGLGAVNLLEAIRYVNRKTKFYQAGSSEMFGNVRTIPQNENTPFYPRSPYGIAKLYAYWMTINYREAYDIFAANGILFNHESPLRGFEFVTRKITDAAAKIKLGKLDTLYLGNLDAIRDWGYAKEYVEGMWLMLQHDAPENFVLASGHKATVRSFVEIAFNALGIEIKFKGEGEKEIGIDTKTNKILVKINPDFYRPAEVSLLLGDPTNANRKLGWKAKMPLEDLCQLMIDNDIQRNRLGINN